jgi:hypothetical protein
MLWVITRCSMRLRQLQVLKPCICFEKDKYHFITKKMLNHYGILFIVSLILLGPFFHYILIEKWLFNLMDSWFFRPDFYFYSFCTRTGISPCSVKIDKICLRSIFLKIIGLLVIPEIILYSIHYS